MKISFKCLTVDFSTAVATTEKEIKGLNAKTVEVQVDWTGLVTTLDGVINILKRTDASMLYTLVDSTNFSFIMAATPGSKIFTFSQWTGSDIKIQIVKNSLTAGTLTVAVNIIK